MARLKTRSCPKLLAVQSVPGEPDGGMTQRHFPPRKHKVLRFFHPTSNASLSGFCRTMRFLRLHRKPTLSAKTNVVFIESLVPFTCTQQRQLFSFLLPILTVAAETIPPRQQLLANPRRPSRPLGMR